MKVNLHWISENLMSLTYNFTLKIVGISCDNVWHCITSPRRASHLVWQLAWTNGKDIHCTGRQIDVRIIFYHKGKLITLMYSKKHRHIEITKQTYPIHFSRFSASKWLEAEHRHIVIEEWFWHTHKHSILSVLPSTIARDWAMRIHEYFLPHNTQSTVWYTEWFKPVNKQINKCIYIEIFTKNW